MKQVSIVLGLGFGDESKGSTTSFLCSQAQKPLVIRFNGGHQAGHTVLHGKHRHTFSNFGSGTMQGAATYWSQFCTLYPTGVLNEWKALQKYQPKLFVHPLAPVATPFDRIHNVTTEADNRHGSCGVGFGSTLARHESYYKIHVQDLYFPSVLEMKLSQITQKLYHKYLPDNWVDIFDKFLETCKFVAENIISTNINFDDYGHYIFEGAQGIMLDMDFGFFPHVTRSNTTSKNAWSIIESMQIKYRLPVNVYYVTRSYQTRHGNGPMTWEGQCPPLGNNEKENNVYNQWQGKFRTGILDADLLRYALQCDSHFSYHFGTDKNLVVTCMDQTGVDFPFADHGELRHGTEALIECLGFDFKSIITNGNPTMSKETIKIWEPIADC
jgi:adenylosuccinate synthase